MPRWSSDDIPWQSFDPVKLDPDLLQLVKAASLTEYNAADYTRYLDNVFHDDLEFRAAAHEWQLEEEQHGRMLGRYAELADPSFDFEDTFKRFREGYSIPTEVSHSVRGSRVGELVARCVVETGTSSFYTALGETAREPVLQAICKHIAADEFRHYRTFLNGARKYQPIENLPLLRCIWVVVGRFREANDDELAFAFHCANETGRSYDHGRANAAYASKAFPLYRFHHVERGMGMVLKAAGLKPNGRLGRSVINLAWWIIKGRAEKFAPI